MFMMVSKKSSFTVLDCCRAMKLIFILTLRMVYRRSTLVKNSASFYLMFAFAFRDSPLAICLNKVL